MSVLCFVFLADHTLKYFNELSPHSSCLSNIYFYWRKKMFCVERINHFCSTRYMNINMLDSIKIFSFASHSFFWVFVDILTTVKLNKVQPSLGFTDHQLWKLNFPFSPLHTVHTSSSLCWNFIEQNVWQKTFW